MILYIKMFFHYCSSGHFSWEKYLKETGAIAAPSSCFRQVPKFEFFTILSPLQFLWCHSTTHTCLSSPSRASHLQSMSSKQGWNWRPRTRGTPRLLALPQWLAWRARAYGCAWMDLTTKMTSGAWWTPLRSSQLAAVRRMAACCSHRLVRTHWYFTMAFLILLIYCRLHIFAFPIVILSTRCQWLTEQNASVSS